MNAVSRAAELINNAKKPLALVGQGVELGNAQKELVEFIEKQIFLQQELLWGCRHLHQTIR